MSHRHAIAWILLIWTLSASLALPNALFSTVIEDPLNDNLAATCSLLWPDGRYPLSSYDHIYNIVILVVTYLVPISTMAILYYQVGKELWGYEAIGENVDKQRRALMAKKKIVKMMIVVVIIFALCWFPYHAFFVVNYYLPTIFQDHPLQYQRSYLIMYWLAMSNSMYNPIIIFFMNSKVYEAPSGQRVPNQLTNTQVHDHNASGRRAVKSALSVHQQSSLTGACETINTEHCLADSNLIGLARGAQVNTGVKHGLQIQLRSGGKDEIQPFLNEAHMQTDANSVIMVTIDHK